MGVGLTPYVHSPTTIDCAFLQQASGAPLALRDFLTPSSTMLPEHEGRGFVVDVSFGDGHSIDPQFFAL